MFDLIVGWFGVHTSSTTASGRLFSRCVIEWSPAARLIDSLSVQSQVRCHELAPYPKVAWGFGTVIAFVGAPASLSAKMTGLS